MAESPAWWAPLAQWGLWLVLMSLVMGWLARSRRQPAARTASGEVLQLPKALLAIGLVAVVFFGACAVLSFGSPTGGPGVAALFLAFALMGSYMVYEYFADRHELRADGLASHTFFGGSRVAQWSDIQSVQYSRSWGWFVLKLRDGKTLRLSAMLVGLPAFAQALLRNVDPTIVRDDSVEILRSTAEGNPPKVWM
jgi:hypothetical protein